MSNEQPANPFVGESTAESYHHYRPRYHHLPCEKIFAILGESCAPVLDVACGTGHGTVALTKHFRTVIGCDASPAMLRVARQSARDIEFIEAEATCLPFTASSFGLITGFMAFHWLDQDRFLSEAGRVLRPGGFLAIDNQGFLGSMPENPAFHEFNREFYRRNFPPVARHPDHPEESLLRARGFTQFERFDYQYPLEMSLEEFTGYLLTQSNLILSRRFSPTSLPQLLREAYAPYFRGRRPSLTFGGNLKIFRSPPFSNALRQSMC